MRFPSLVGHCWRSATYCSSFSLTGRDLENDADNCGEPFFVCPESCESSPPSVPLLATSAILTLADRLGADNGVGERICNYGQCKLKCPPGLEHKLNHLFPHITFCA